MSRYTGPVRFRGPSIARPAEDAGRKLLGELVARTPAGGVNQARRTLGDGTELTVAIAGDQRQITATPPPAAGAQASRGEEMIRVYIGSSGGLRILDLGTGEVLATITGLEAFEVDAVSDNGRIVHMSGSQLAVRVDLAALSAFGQDYTVDTIAAPGSGLAFDVAFVRSPDGTRLAGAFGRVLNPSTSAVMEGLGGYLLADAETLAPLRGGLHCSYRAYAVAWAPDSQHFYVISALPSDGTSADVAVTTSTADYVAQYTRDGALVATRQLASWSFTPDAGYARLIRALAVHPDGTRLYAVAEPSYGAGWRLYALDLTDPTLPVVADVALPEVSYSLSLSHAGSRLVAVGSAGVLYEFDTRDDALALVTHTTPAFDSTAITGVVFTSNWDNGVLRNGPRSRLGRQPDTRRFFLTKNGTVPATLFAYRNLDETPVYTLPLDALNVFERYRLISAGPRVLP